jgi:D-alanine-D-alanine ligase
MHTDHISQITPIDSTSPIGPMGPKRGLPGAKRTAVVLGGGTNDEHDVSRASVRDIAAAIDPREFRVAHLVLGRDDTWRSMPDGRELQLQNVVAILESADVAIPAFHGAGGEDGTIAGLLELVGIPYVGAGVAAGSFGMDKFVTKLIANDAGVAVAPGIAVSGSDDRRLLTVPLPAVVKPNQGGSSHGLSLVLTPGDLGAAIELALLDDTVVLVEAMVDGREIDIGVLELPDGSLRCSPPLEILTPDGAVYDTDAKYGGEPIFSLPAAVTAGTTQPLQDAAVRVFRALGCRGLARVDFFCTASGIVLNEVNTFPGFTGHSQFPRMFQAAGIEYGDLVATLIETAIARRPLWRPRAPIALAPDTEHPLASAGRN